MSERPEPFVSIGPETIGGMAALLAKLDRLDNDLAGAAVDDALLAAAEVVKAEAMQRVPVRSGTLRDSIYAASNRTVPVGLRRTKARQGTSKVAAAAYHAHLVEYGTRHARKQPFLRPALDNKSEAALNEFERVLLTKVAL